MPRESGPRFGGGVIALGAVPPAGAEDIRAFWLGCWHNGDQRPVLKHGPRSQALVRVLGGQTRPRNEGELSRWEPSGGHHRPGLKLLRRDLSKSISAWTRKIANYACVG